MIVIGLVFADSDTTGDFIVGGGVSGEGMTDTVENGSICGGGNYGGNAVAFSPLLSSPSSPPLSLLRHQN